MFYVEEKKKKNNRNGLTEFDLYFIALSYSSAASSTANGSKRPAPAKARVAPSAKPPQNSSEPSVDETSYRLGGNLL